MTAAPAGTPAFALQRLQDLRHEIAASEKFGERVAAIEDEEQKTIRVPVNEAYYVANILQFVQCNEEILLRALGGAAADWRDTTEEPQKGQTCDVEMLDGSILKQANFDKVDWAVFMWHTLSIDFDAERVARWRPS
jgi:hypothetical protein